MTPSLDEDVLRTAPPDLTEDEHAQAIAEAFQNPLGDWGCLLVPSILVMLLLASLVAGSVPSRVAKLVLVAAILIPLVFFSIIASRRTRRRLLETVRHQGADLCDHCGYALRGNPRAAHCPECGQPVAAMVRLGGARLEREDAKASKPLPSNPFLPSRKGLSPEIHSCIAETFSASDSTPATRMIEEWSVQFLRVHEAEPGDRILRTILRKCGGRLEALHDALQLAILTKPDVSADPD